MRRSKRHFRKYLGFRWLLGGLLLMSLGFSGCGGPARTATSGDKLYNAAECHRLKKERRYSLIRKPKVCWMFF